MLPSDVVNKQYHAEEVRERAERKRILAEEARATFYQNLDKEVSLTARVIRQTCNAFIAVATAKLS